MTTRAAYVVVSAWPRSDYKAEVRDKLINVDVGKRCFLQNLAEEAVVWEADSPSMLYMPYIPVHVCQVYVHVTFYHICI